MWTSRARIIAALVLSLSLCAPAHASTISVGSFTPGAPPATFLVPVEIAGAVDLQTWQFDLLFDNTIVEAVSISGAEFTAGNPDTTSFILAGFIFNNLGLVDDVAGSYPSLLTGPSGGGVLALIEFRFLDGQEGGDPGFQVDDASMSEAVPVPASVLLLLAGVLLARARRLPRA